MTFAEMLFFLGALILVYALLTPLQRHLESRLRKFFRSFQKQKDKPVIDITDYQKKDNNKV